MKTIASILISALLLCAPSFGNNMFPDNLLIGSTPQATSHQLPPVAPCDGTMDPDCVANAKAAWSTAIVIADMDYGTAATAAESKKAADLERYNNLVRNPDWSDAHWNMVRRHVLSAAIGAYDNSMAAALTARTNAYFDADAAYQDAMSLCCTDLLFLLGSDCSTEPQARLDNLADFLAAMLADPAQKHPDPPACDPEPADTAKYADCLKDAHDAFNDDVSDANAKASDLASEVLNGLTIIFNVWHNRHDNAATQQEIDAACEAMAKVGRIAQQGVNTMYADWVKDIDAAKDKYTQAAGDCCNQGK